MAEETLMWKIKVNYRWGNEVCMAVTCLCLSDCQYIGHEEERAAD